MLSRGANIAESYDDYLKLGFSLVDGLGPEGRDIYHALCAQSSKYRERDCERKWQECLSKHDGRTTIRTFYKMAQDAGVDLSEIGRQFPSIPSNPHGFSENYDSMVVGMSNNNEHANNEDVMSGQDAVSPTKQISRDGSEGMRVLRESVVSDTGHELEKKLAYSETFSNKLKPDSIPSLLQNVVDTQLGAENRDKVGIAALIIWSGCMPNVEGVYDEKRVSPELYAILNAPSAIANKGAVDACRQLVMPIEWEIRPKQRKGMKEPKEPKYQSLFIAGNSSAAVVYEDLDSNGGHGIIFETESSTLSDVQAQEWGQWSDLLRKAFHHERATLSRKTEKVRIAINHPCLAVLLTCTPGQIPLLLPATWQERLA